LPTSVGSIAHELGAKERKPRAPETALFATHPSMGEGGRVVAAKYLIDTDICIYAMSRRRGPRTHRLLDKLRRDGLAISVITYGEVMEGVLRSERRGLNMQLWHDLLAPFDVLGVAIDIAEVWADVRGTLRARGELIPDADMLIGSTALRFGMTMVTNNVSHFERIDGLEILRHEAVASG